MDFQTHFNLKSKSKTSIRYRKKNVMLFVYMIAREEKENYVYNGKLLIRWNSSEE